MKPLKRSFSAAFTLLEIMLVVAITSLLLGSAFYFLGPQIEIARDAKIKTDFQALSQSLQTYENLNGFLPTTQQGLQVLVTAPTSDPKPNHWYQMLKELPKDPYQSEYVYVYPGKHNPQSFDIYSKGKNKIDESGSGDDKGSWDLK